MPNPRPRREPDAFLNKTSRSVDPGLYSTRFSVGTRGIRETSPLVLYHRREREGMTPNTGHVVKTVIPAPMTHALLKMSPLPRTARGFGESVPSAFRALPSAGPHATATSAPIITATRIEPGRPTAAASTPGKCRRAVTTAATAASAEAAAPNHRVPRASKPDLAQSNQTPTNSAADRI